MHLNSSTLPTQAPLPLGHPPACEGGSWLMSMLSSWGSCRMGSPGSPTPSCCGDSGGPCCRRGGGGGLTRRGLPRRGGLCLLWLSLSLSLSLSFSLSRSRPRSFSAGGAWQAGAQAGTGTAQSASSQTGCSATPLRCTTHSFPVKLPKQPLRSQPLPPKLSLPLTFPSFPLDRKSTQAREFLRIPSLPLSRSHLAKSHSKSTNPPTHPPSPPAAAPAPALSGSGAAAARMLATAPASGA